MAYDGRARTDVAWWKQEIDVVGYHYYLSPSKAEMRIKKFETLKTNYHIALSVMRIYTRLYSKSLNFFMDN